jgi:hypothetical protein
VAPLVDDFPLRLSNVPVRPGDAHRSGFFRSLWDVEAAERQFRVSEFVARFWPASLREDTLGNFRWQRIINRVLSYDGEGGVVEQDLYDVLTESSLRTLPLWILGSKVEEQRIVEGLSGRRAERPGVQKVRGIGALADREYRRAVRSFVRASAGLESAPRLVALEIFALCMAGEVGEATVLARRLVETSDAATRSDEHWRFMEATFGLPDPR